MKVREEDTPGVLITDLLAYLALLGSYARVIVSLLTEKLYHAAVKIFAICGAYN